MVAHANRVRFATATTGTGTMAIGAAVSGFQTPATAGLPSGATVGYCIEENANFEVGQGVLTNGTPWTLSRPVIEASSNSGAAISLLGTATVFLTLTAAELDQMAALTYPRYSILHRLAMPQTGLLIPAYIYPNNPYTDATYRAFIALIRQYRDVPVIVVIDPSSGPGSAWDGNWAAAIKLLKAAGALTVGYVSTAYAARAASAVQADVMGWQSLYGATLPDGIFYDEMPWDPGTGNANVNLYKSYYSFAKSAGFSFVIGNPGTNQQQIWYDNPTADIIVTWETSVWPAEADLAGNFIGGHGDYDYRVNSVLVYNQPSLDLAQFSTFQKYAKWIFVNNLNLPGPWNGLPPYLGQIFRAAQQSGQQFVAPAGRISTAALGTITHH